MALKSKNKKESKMSQEETPNAVNSINPLDAAVAGVAGTAAEVAKGQPWAQASRADQVEKSFGETFAAMDVGGGQDGKAKAAQGLADARNVLATKGRSDLDGPSFGDTMDAMKAVQPEPASAFDVPVTPMTETTMEEPVGDADELKSTGSEVPADVVNASAYPDKSAMSDELASVPHPEEATTVPRPEEPTTKEVDSDSKEAVMTQAYPEEPATVPETTTTPTFATVPETTMPPTTETTSTVTETTMPSTAPDATINPANNPPTA